MNLPAATVDQLPEWISLLQPSSPQLPEVVSTVESLLAGVPSRDLFTLDQQVRRRDGWQAGGWRSVTAADVRLLAERSGDGATVGAAASMHRNGFVREAAVRLLDELDNPDVVRWLVVRTTDWVPEVRTAATSAVFRRLDPTHADALVDVLPLVSGRRFEINRATHRVRAAVLAMLASPDCIPALHRGKRHIDRLVQRRVFAVLAGVEPTNELLREALRTGDVVAANTVARTVLASPGVRQECIRLLAKARLAPLRAEAVWEARDDPRLTTVVHDGLYDRSVTVRRLAQQVAGFDAGRLGELYRGALKQPDRREVALHGLADIGDGQEAAAATESLTDPRARVRVAATRLLATSGGPATGNVLVGLVCDPSSRVACEAIRGLLARGLSEAAADQLFDAAVSGPESVRRRVFRRVLPHTSKWWQLRYGLSAIRGDTVLCSLGAELVAHAIDSWNRSFTEPRPQELHELRANLDAAIQHWPRQDSALADTVCSILAHSSPRRSADRTS